MSTQNGTTAANGKGTNAQDQEVHDSLAQEQPAEGEEPAENPAAAEETAAQENAESETDPRDARITELEGSVAALTTQLEERAAELQAKADEISAARTESQSALAGVQQSLADQLAAAAGRYRDLALAANPEVPAEIVTGLSIDQVDQSIEQAKAVVQKVREQLGAQAAAQVGAGAPVRQGPDVDSMSGLDKIKYALSQRRK